MPRTITIEDHIEVKGNIKEITPEDFNVAEINSIKYKYVDLRQLSKAPTFLLTYNGTHHGLQKNCGFSLQEAKEIEDNYHKLYKVSDEWVESHIKKATEVGYVVTGFGLKVRTPILKHTVYSKNMFPAAKAEARTAGNALGQGWGVLNDRARNEVIAKIDEAGLSLDILPVAAIHDANYFLVRNDAGLVRWLNEAVTEAAAWQEHPTIAHPTVKLSGSLDLFYPSWANEITLKRGDSEEEIIKKCQEAVAISQI